MTVITSGNDLTAQEFLDLTKADMERVNAPLEDHEKIAKLVLVKDRWTAEDGLLTPTLKVRRGDVEARYAEVVAREALQREVLISWV